MHSNSFQVKSVKDNAFRSLCRSNVVSKQDVKECDASNKNASTGFIDIIDTLGSGLSTTVNIMLVVASFLLF